MRVFAAKPSAMRSPRCGGVPLFARRAVGTRLTPWHQSGACLPVETLTAPREYYPVQIGSTRSPACRSIFAHDAAASSRYFTMNRPTSAYLAALAVAVILIAAHLSSSSTQAAVSEVITPTQEQLTRRREAFRTAAAGLAGAALSQRWEGLETNQVFEALGPPDGVYDNRVFFYIDTPVASQDVGVHVRDGVVVDLAIFRSTPIEGSSTITEAERIKVLGDFFVGRSDADLTTAFAGSSAAKILSVFGMPEKVPRQIQLSEDKWTNFTEIWSYRNFPRIGQLTEFTFDTSTPLNRDSVVHVAVRDLAARGVESAVRSVASLTGVGSQQPAPSQEPGPAIFFVIVGIAVFIFFLWWQTRRMEPKHLSAGARAEGANRPLSSSPTPASFPTAPPFQAASREPVTARDHPAASTPGAVARTATEEVLSQVPSSAPPPPPSPAPPPTTRDNDDSEPDPHNAGGYAGRNATSSPSATERLGDDAAAHRDEGAGARPRSSSPDASTPIPPAAPETLKPLDKSVKPPPQSSPTSAAAETEDGSSLPQVPDKQPTPGRPDEPARDPEESPPRRARHRTSASAYEDDSEPNPHDAARYAGRTAKSSPTSSAPPTAPTDHDGWPLLKKINVTNSHRAKGNAKSEDVTEKDWQGYHWEASCGFGNVEAPMQTLAVDFVTGFSERGITGTLYWDSAVRRTETVFGFVILHPIHRRIHLSTRITYRHQSDGVEVVVVQDLINYASIKSKTFMGLLGVGALALLALSMIYASAWMFTVGGGFTAVILVLHFLQSVKQASEDRDSKGWIRRLIGFPLFGNPRVAIAAQPEIVSTRNSIMRLLSALRDSAQSAQ